MRLVPSWFVAALGLTVVACGGSRSERISCIDPSACGDEQVCLRGYCTAIEGARVAASASAVGANANVYVIDADGKACEARMCPDLPYGSRVTFRAELIAGARFVGWSGSPECTGSSPELVIESLTTDTQCVANYVLRRRVSGEVVGVEGGGVLASSRDPNANCDENSCEVDVGTVVQLEATDRWGERFVGWTGAGCGDAPSRTLEVTARDIDLTCTATFQPRVTIGGKAMGVDVAIEVSTSSQFRSCEPGSCTIDKGSSAQLNAPEVEGFRFAGWSGTPACTGSDPQLIIQSASISQLCIATYLRRFLVRGSTLGATPAPEVTATSYDQDAKCADGACEVDRHGTVTLIAWSSPGYRLDRWSDCGEEERGAALELADVSADMSCVANYVPGIAVIGAVVGAPGDVKASSTTPGASCAGSGCVIPPNGAVTLEAPTVEGYRFQSWGGEPGCAGDQLVLRVANVTQSLTCEAKYFMRYVVRGLTAPTEGGRVLASSANAGAACRDNQCTLDEHGAVELHAEPAAGYRFSGWSGGAACTGNALDVTIPDVQRNVTCQANFILRAAVMGYASPENGGRVEAFSDSGSAECRGNTCTVDEGARVQLMATPAMGYVFDGWSECSDSREVALRIDDVRRPITCRATFVPRRFTVTSNVMPNASGSVGAFSSAPAADCRGGQCTVNYGSDVRLTANPALGYRFVSWSGCGNGSDPVLVVANVRENRACQATFARIVLSVSASPNPSAGGSVSATSNTPSASCMGTRCNVPYGGSATLVATPARGYRFTDWTGCGPGSNATLQLDNLSSSLECRANFELSRFAVSGMPNPADGGTVQASSGGSATCNGGRCSVDAGASVTLLATARDGYRFAGWSGCQISDRPSITIANVSADVSCRAAFERVFITVTGVAQTGGTLSVPCVGATCSASVAQGARVTFTAVPNPGFMFNGWSGTGCMPNGLSATVEDVRAATTCTAAFAPIPPPVFIVTGFANSGGSLTAPCTGMSCPVNVVQGGSASFTAKPDADHDFDRWEGTGCVADGLRATVSNVQAATSCTASFKKKPPRMFTVTAIANTGGTLDTPCTGSPCPTTVVENGSVTFTAVPNDRYVLAGWSGEGCVGSGNAVTVSNVRADTMCTASFEAVRTPTYDVSVIADKGGSLRQPCPGAMCATQVEEGKSIELEAVPADTHTFDRWIGERCAGQPSRFTLTNVRANVMCTATFALKPKPRFVVRGVALAGGTWIAPCPNNECMLEVEQGQSVEFRASASAGNRVAGWGDDCIGNQDSAVVSNVQRDSTCTVRFEPDTFPVTAIIGVGGTLSSPACNSSPCTFDVPRGDSLELIARAESGFRFAGWSGTGCNVDGPSDTSANVANVQSERKCTASFREVPTHQVSAAANPGGTLSAPCSGMSCAPRSVPEGGSVTFTAEKSTGYHFTNWSGCSNSENASITLVVGADIHCIANFAADQHTVTVRAGPNGSITAPCTAQASSFCTDSVAHGTARTFSARASDGYEFESWSGTNCPVPSNGASIEVRGDVDCVANFARKVHKITVTAGAHGRIESPCRAPASTSCNADIPHGTSVSFAAIEDEGYDEADWSGPSCPVSSNGSAEVREDIVCNVNFDVIPTYEVTITASGDGTGTIGPCRESKCARSVRAGGTLSFTAQESEDSVFVGWTGDCAGKQGLQLELGPVTRNMQCGATFQKRPEEPVRREYTVVGTVLGQGGTFSAPEECRNLTTCRLIVEEGDGVEFAARAESDKVRLARWSGSCRQDESPNAAYIQNVTENATCVAEFEPIATESETSER